MGWDRWCCRCWAAREAKSTVCPIHQFIQVSIVEIDPDLIEPLRSWGGGTWSGGTAIAPQQVKTLLKWFYVGSLSRLEMVIGITGNTIFSFACCLYNVHAEQYQWASVCFGMDFMVGILETWQTSCSRSLSLYSVISQVRAVLSWWAWAIATEPNIATKPMTPLSLLTMGTGAAYVVRAL
jgi:hypothetical protein